MNKAIEIGATPDFNKSSLFALACERDASLVKMMIQHGAFPNSRISVGWELRRPLNIASEQGAMEVVKVLVENGADVNGTDASEHVRWWPLLLACRGGYFGVATFLLQRGSKVDFVFFSSPLFNFFISLIPLFLPPLLIYIFFIQFYFYFIYILIGTRPVIRCPTTASSLYMSA